MSALYITNVSHSDKIITYFFKLQMLMSVTQIMEVAFRCVRTPKDLSAALVGQDISLIMMENHVLVSHHTIRKYMCMQLYCEWLNGHVLSE